MPRDYTSMQLISSYRSCKFRFLISQETQKKKENAIGVLNQSRSKKRKFTIFEIKRIES